jgi:hypothetical protein
MQSTSLSAKPKKGHVASGYDAPGGLLVLESMGDRVVAATLTGTSHLRMALNLVNASLPAPVTMKALNGALSDACAPCQPAARILLEEASAQLLAGLVAEGCTDWPILAGAAERYPPARHETATWLRDMARLALA